MNIWFWIGLCVLIFIILLYMLVCFMIHHHVFGHRCILNPDVRYYTKEEFGLETKNFSVTFHHTYLKGFYYFYPNVQENKILVVSHGMWGSHKAYLQEIEYFARNGFIVLGFDNAGTDLSGGKSLKGLGNSLACLNTAIEQVAKDYPNAPISVFGHSWGGYAARGIAKYQKNISATISMSGFISVYHQLLCYFPKKLAFLIPGMMLIEWFQCGKYSFLNTQKVLKNTKIPTLLVHSRDDQMVPFERHTGVLQRNLDNSNVEIMIVDGKKHNPDYSIDAIKYTEESYRRLNQLPKEEKTNFFRNLDFHRMGALDSSVMDEIVDFLRRTIK